MPPILKLLDDSGPKPNIGRGKRGQSVTNGSRSVARRHQDAAAARPLARSGAPCSPVRTPEGWSRVLRVMRQGRNTLRQKHGREEFGGGGGESRCGPRAGESGSKPPGGKQVPLHRKNARSGPAPARTREWRRENATNRANSDEAVAIEGGKAYPGKTTGSSPGTKAMTTRSIVTGEGIGDCWFM